MKVLWLCNTEIPIISRELNKEPCVFGGWLSQISDIMIQEHEVVFLYPCAEGLHAKKDRFSFYQFNENNCFDYFDIILKDEKPDLIHIWGTEFYHSGVMMRVLKNMGLLDRTVVSIQGLISVYALHYSVGVPEKIRRHRTLHDFLRGGSILDGERDYIRKGRSEIDLLKNAKNIIGRTDFDYSAVKAINPSVVYHFCNEVLRPEFYTDDWSVEGIRRHSVFISQCNYPIKGLHFLIKALSIVKEIYPDVHVYATGYDLREKAKDYLRRSTYQLYISRLLDEYGLSENITFLGSLNAVQMKEQYLKCNVFVSPSTIENSSNSIGEAMLLGCPIVASNVGGTKSILTDEKEGFLYPCPEYYMLASYLIRIFGDDELAARLGANAKKHAMVTHDKNANVARLLEVYFRIAEK